MPEDNELETKDLQEAIDEMQEQRKDREAEEKRSSWTRYIGLSTAVFAVFAAIAAVQAASLVNEAVIDQVKSSDAWNEYQASREKAHLYGITIDSLVDSQSASPGVVKPTGTIARKGGLWTPMDPRSRAKEYEAEVEKENNKSKDLMKKANALQKESQTEFHRHHYYAYSVALIQVAIALGAIAALARVKYVWFLSLACGVIGLCLFVMGVVR